MSLTETLQRIFALLVACLAAWPGFTLAQDVQPSDAGSVELRLQVQFTVLLDDAKI